MNNKVLICLDYNETVDNLQAACYDAECRDRIPTFFSGVRTLAARTKSDIEIAFVSGAKVSDIADEISVLNGYANIFAGTLTNKGPLFKYIIGGRLLSISHQPGLHSGMNESFQLICICVCVCNSIEKFSLARKCFLYQIYVCVCVCISL